VKDIKTINNPNGRLSALMLKSVTTDAIAFRRTSHGVISWRTAR